MGLLEETLSVDPDADQGEDGDDNGQPVGKIRDAPRGDRDSAALRRLSFDQVVDFRRQVFEIVFSDLSRFQFDLTLLETLDPSHEGGGLGLTLNDGVLKADEQPFEATKSVHEGDVADLIVHQSRSVAFTAYRRRSR